MPAVTRVTASSQVAALSGAPFPSRTSGVNSRSGWSSSSAAVQPFWHSPPRFVGKSLGPTSTDPSARSCSVMPHCNAQYGQWVATVIA
jgi:hypothetical protein